VGLAQGDGWDVDLPRGTITFLLTDVEGSTRMWQNDPAGASAAMARHDEIVADVLARHRGVKPRDQGEGDSIVAVFPRAGDALDGALALQLAFANEAWPDGSTVRVRMALHTGEAELGNGNYKGGAIIRCARIRNLGHGEQLLVSETTAHVVSDALPPAVTLADLGVHPLKGLDRAERIFQVRHPELRAEFPALASGGGDPMLLPTSDAVSLPAMFGLARGGAFAGRGDELDRLESIWSMLDDAGPRFVGLAGEPGMGKSRLSAEFAASVHARGATVLAGRCSEEPLRPFEPFAEALVGYVRTADVDDMAARLGRLAAPLGALVPDLAGPTPLAAPSRRSLGTADAGDERAVLFDAVGSLIREVATSAPVLLVLEDLHWASQPTLSLLRSLLRPVPPVPLLIIGTYRDTELDRIHPLAAALADFSREPNVERIALAGLDDAAIAECLAAEDQLDVERALVGVLRERTHGNPLFVRELMRHLREAGDADKLPEGVREVIGRRLARLPEGVTRALRAAAVIGPTFDFAVLDAVPMAIDGDDLLDMLDLAVEAGLVAEETDGRDAYAFTHAMVRQTLYDEMSSARRVRLHGQVLDAIASVHGERDSSLPALAHHAAESARAGSCERAVHYALRASEAARARHADEEARQIIDRALQVIELEPEPRPEWEAQLRLELSESLWQTDPKRHVAELEAALDLARSADLRDLRARAADYLANELSAVGREDPVVQALYEEAVVASIDAPVPLRAEVLADVAAYWMNSGGRPDLADRYSKEALAVANASDDIDAKLWATGMRCGLLWGMPPSVERVSLLADVEALSALVSPRHPLAGQARYLHARQALELCELDARERLASLRDDEQLPDAPRWYTAGLLALLDGAFEKAEAANEQGLAASVHADFQSNGLAQLFLLRREQGRIAELEPIAAVAIEATPGLEAFEAALALARCELHRRDEAAAMFDRFAADDFSSLLTGMVRSVSLGVLAELAVRLDRVDEAPGLYDLLAPYAGTCIVAGVAGCCIGAADRGLGQLATVLGRFDDAQQHFEAALSFEERLGAPPLVARSRYWMAQMLLRRRNSGDVDEAIGLLGLVVQTTDDLGMATLADESRACLDALE